MDQKHWEALEQLDLFGAESLVFVWCKSLAITLREVENTHPGYIYILVPSELRDMGFEESALYNSQKSLAIFAAFRTKQGEKELKKYRKKNPKLLN